MALQRRSLFWFFLAGLPVSAASFMSFGNMTILLLLGAYALAHLAHTGVGRWREWLGRYWAGAVVFSASAFSLWGFYQLVYGVSFWDVFSTAMATHLFLGRSYWVWLGYNLYDFVTFLGIPVAVVVILATVRTWTRAIPRLRRKEPAGAPASVPILAFGVALLALDLSGVSLGEVGRIWLPWMSMACVVAAVWLTRPDSRTSYRLALVLLAVQTLSFTLFLRVSATGMPDYAPRDPQRARPEVARPLEATLGEHIRLLGYEVTPQEARPGETVTVTLYWQAVAQPARPYTVFTHLIGPDGALQAQQDNMPQGGDLPTTCWRPGEYVTDRYQITLPPEAPAGTYTLRAGMYTLPGGERLPVRAGREAPGDALTLTSVEVVAP